MAALSPVEPLRPSKAAPSRPSRVITASSAFAVDTPQWLAAVEQGRAGRGESEASLRVITWNVWFDSFYMEERFHALVTTVLRRRPDVLCLQEVVPKVATSLRASAILTGAYDISSNDVRPYGCLILAHKSLRAVFSETAFEVSIMNRSLLTAELRGEGKQAWKTGAVATVRPGRFCAKLVSSRFR